MFTKIILGRENSNISYHVYFIGHIVTVLMIRKDTISIRNEIRPIQEHGIRMSRWWAITVPECVVHCAKRQEDKSGQIPATFVRK